MPAAPARHPGQSRPASAWRAATSATARTASSSSTPRGTGWGGPDAPQRLAPGNGCSGVAQGGGGGGLVLAGLAFGSAVGVVARLCRYSAGPAAWVGCKSALTAAKQLLGVVVCAVDKVLLLNPTSEMLCSPSQELPLRLWKQQVQEFAVQVAPGESRPWLPACKIKVTRKSLRRLVACCSKCQLTWCCCFSQRVK